MTDIWLAVCMIGLGVHNAQTHLQVYERIICCCLWQAPVLSDNSGNMDRLLTFVPSGKADTVLQPIPLYNAHALISCFLNNLQLLSGTLTRALSSVFLVITTA